MQRDRLCGPARLRVGVGEVVPRVQGAGVVPVPGPLGLSRATATARFSGFITPRKPARWPPLTSRHRTGTHQTVPTVLPGRETDQQRATLKLFGAAAPLGVVLR